MIRGKKVMLDRDLAEMYGVETRRLNEQVSRNVKRFPSDFMFQLTTKEMKNWMSQFATSKKMRMGLRKRPNAFTEQGVAMLSSVLGSDTAIEVNIRIIRVFTRMREMVLTHKDILLKLEQIEKEMAKQGSRLSKHEREMEMVFSALKQLLNPVTPPMPKIGFKRREEK